VARPAGAGAAAAIGLGGGARSSHYHASVRPVNPPAHASRSYVGYVVALLFAVNVVNYLDRSIVGILVEPIRHDLAISDTQIGFMTGLAFSLFYAIAGVYLSHLGDTRNRASIMAVSMVAWSAMTALTGAAHSFWQLLAARVGVGVGEASVIPMANAMLADYHRAERRPFALAVFTAGAMVGIMAGSLLGGYIAAKFGWRWAFVAAALPGLPLAAIIWFTLRDPPRGASDGLAAVAPIALPRAIRTLVSSPVLVLLMLGYTLLVFMLFGVINWFPAFLVRVHGMALARVGATFGLAIGLGTAFGSIVGGLVASRLAASDLRWLTRLPPWLLLAAWPLYELAIYAPDATISLAVLCLVSTLIGAAVGPVLAAYQTTLPPAMRATGAALLGFVGSLIGVGGGPLLVGVLSDHYAPLLGSAAALQRALAISVCAGGLGWALLMLAHRAFARALRT
jgi:predicted MFS family arabinose efflux permease